MPKKKAKTRTVRRKKALAKTKSKPLKKALRNKVTSKQTTRKKSAVRSKASGKKKSVATTATRQKGARMDAQNPESKVFAPQGRRSQSAGQSGDLQGLSEVENADSESVDELIEEGNAFEADVVAGVERAGNNDEEEVHTHEVPEDDVPGEYLDED
jgi:hypothetical protein